MQNSLKKILKVGGPSICSQPPIICDLVDNLAGSLRNQLLDVLKEKNGFYAFESALHVLPAQTTDGHIGLDVWNDPSLWKSAFDGLADDLLFFAEDIFGGQFCIKEGAVYSFEPETAELTPVADELNGWATAILSNYEVMTGYPIAHRWQEVYGQVPNGKRLVPKTPFVLGGEYAVENLYLLDATRAMQLMGDIATQIKNLPEGSKIKFRIVD